MKGKIGWGSSFFRQGDALQTRPVLGVAARSTDREPSSFLDKQVGWLDAYCRLTFKAFSAHLRSSGPVPGIGILLPGQSRPELTFSVSNAFSPLSVHSEAEWILQQTHSHANPRTLQELYWLTCQPSGRGERVQGGEQQDGSCRQWWSPSSAACGRSSGRKLDRLPRQCCSCAGFLN